MTDGNQPAFPEIHIHHFQNEDTEGKHDNVVPRWNGGLTKREYFAAMAMQGLLALPTPMTKVEGVSDLTSAERWAKLSLLMADALIAELGKK